MNKYANWFAKDKHVVTYQNFCEFPVDQTRPIAISRVLQDISNPPINQLTNQQTDRWTNRQTDQQNGL